MPVVNGIEFAARIKGHSPSTKILLSCHEDFEYAQEGMRLGTAGYLVKTSFKKEELAQYLQNFQKEILGARGKYVSNPELGEKFFQWMCGFNNEFEQELTRLFSVQWSWMKKPFYALFVESEPSVIASLEKTYETISCGPAQCFMFVRDADKENAVTTLIDLKYEIDHFHWLISKPISGPNEWLETVKSMKRYADFEFKSQISTAKWPASIKEAVRYIIDHLSQPIRASEVAEVVGLSRSHFSTLFKKTAGESFHGFIDRRKMEWAKELLVETQAPIRMFLNK